MEVLLQNNGYRICVVEIDLIIHKLECAVLEKQYQEILWDVVLMEQYYL